MRVLVVEDEKRIRDFLKENLKPDYYEIDLASDGQKGLELMRLNNYDLVILDNVLPKKTGLEVCIEARKAQVASPILVLSVLSDVKQKIALLEAGADDYLAKPFSFKELQARMNALLRRPTTLQQEVLQIGDIRLNMTTHEVTQGKREVSLTRKEFMLLRYFMKNAGLVLSRGMLIEHVWDMNADPFSNTIEAHIVSLRKKLGGPSQKIIQTISGRGYKFIKNSD